MGSPANPYSTHPRAHDGCFTVCLVVLEAHGGTRFTPPCPKSHRGCPRRQQQRPDPRRCDPLHATMVRVHGRLKLFPFFLGKRSWSAFGTSSARPFHILLSLIGDEAQVRRSARRRKGRRFRAAVVSGTRGFRAAVVNGNRSSISIPTNDRPIEKGTAIPCCGG